MADQPGFEQALERMVFGSISGQRASQNPALWPIGAAQAARCAPQLKTVFRYLDNIVKSPAEPKYRQVNTHNAKFQDVCELDGGRAAFDTIGFRELPGEGRLILPPEVPVGQLQQLLVKVTPVRAAG